MKWVALLLLLPLVAGEVAIITLDYDGVDYIVANVSVDEGYAPRELPAASGKDLDIVIRYADEEGTIRVVLPELRKVEGTKANSTELEGGDIRITPYRTVRLVGVNGGVESISVLEKGKLLHQETVAKKELVPLFLVIVGIGGFVISSGIYFLSKR